MSTPRKCPVCGTELKPYQKKYCSRQCNGRSGKGRAKSESMRKKLSETNTGRKLSEETKQKISESHKKENLSQETLLKMSKSATGRKLSESTKSKLRDISLEVLNTPEMRKKISDNTKKAFENYTYDPSVDQDEYRRKAIETYGYVCCICGKSSGVLHVHHMDGDHYNDDIDNLCVLCNSCHFRSHQDPQTGRHESIPSTESIQYILEHRKLLSDPSNLLNQ